MVNPSGYWGASRKMNQTGRKKVAIRLSDATATISLEVRLILFVFILLI